MTAARWDSAYWQQVVVRAVAGRVQAGPPMSAEDQAIVELIVAKCWPAGLQFHSMPIGPIATKAFGSGGTP